MGGHGTDPHPLAQPRALGTGREDEAGAGPCQVSANIVEVKCFGFGEEERNLASSLHRWLSADSMAPAGMAKNNQGSALPLWCWDINFTTSKQPGNSVRRQLLRVGLWVQFLSSHPLFPLPSPDLSRKRGFPDIWRASRALRAAQTPQTHLQQVLSSQDVHYGTAHEHCCSANPPQAA